MAVSVLIVDDSEVIRFLLTKSLERDADIRVVATAANGLEAVELSKRHTPDVVLLDIEMPVMDGMTALPLILGASPFSKIIVISGNTLGNAGGAIAALGRGASEFILKPGAEGALDPQAFNEDVRNKVKALLANKLRPIQEYNVARPPALPEPAPKRPAPLPPMRPVPAPAPAPAATPVLKPVPAPHPPAPAVAVTASKPPAPIAPPTAPAPAPNRLSPVTATPAAPPRVVPVMMGPATTPSLISLVAPATAPIHALAIAASTGGPEALKYVLQRLQGELAQIPIFITQHMPPVFTAALADQISQISHRLCVEGMDGQMPQPGVAYLAPGGYHMVLTQRAGKTVIRLTQDPPVNSCRPSADPMFASISQIYGENVLAVVLTGIGNDGAQGAKVIQTAGGSVIAQDQETSAVYGMPRSVAELGVCEAILPIGRIAPYVVDRCKL